MKDRYFLPSGYKSNKIELTKDKVSGEPYWNKDRVRASKYFQAPVYKYCIRLIERENAKSIVDVGCGVGTKLVDIHTAFPELRIAGVDQVEAVRFCKQNLSFGHWISDDFSSGEPSGSFEEVDVVICADVIEHLLEPDSLLKYLANISTSHTKIVISTPDRVMLHGANRLDCPNDRHVRSGPEEFREYVASRGVPYSGAFPCACLQSNAISANSSSRASEADSSKAAEK